VVEGARLESVYRGNSIEGSNPSLSATPIDTSTHVFSTRYVFFSFVIVKLLTKHTMGSMGPIHPGAHSVWDFGADSVWTWTALDAGTKLMRSWMIGNRGADAALDFMEDLASRLANRIQLTPDGH
jgi:hypothetical protein